MIPAASVKLPAYAHPELLNNCKPVAGLITEKHRNVAKTRMILFICTPTMCDILNPPLKIALPSVCGVTTVFKTNSISTRVESITSHYFFGCD